MFYQFIIAVLFVELIGRHIRIGLKEYAGKTFRLDVIFDHGHKLRTDALSLKFFINAKLFDIIVGSLPPVTHGTEGCSDQFAFS